MAPASLVHQEQVQVDVACAAQKVPHHFPSKDLGVKKNGEEIKSENYWRLPTPSISGHNQLKS
jgi:hypothetical protein